MRRISVVLLMLALGACTSISYDFGDIASPGPRFRDRDPHHWTSRTPWSYPVHGTDVAKYQNAVNWSKLRKEGLAFAFIKATEGGDRFDERFEENWSGARRAGIPRGAYHFFYFCRPAIEQAAWFINHVPKERSSLPPVLDVEWNPASPTCRLHPDPQTVRAEMKVFLDAVAEHYGKKPIIYTTVDFFEDNDLTRFRSYPFWLRSVAAYPDDKYRGLTWVFWQYTGTGIVPGIEGDADLNTFNGGTDDWRKWLNANTT